MKVAIDINRMHKLSLDRGIGIYAKNLYKALKKYTDVDVELVTESSGKKFDLIHYPFFDFFSRTLKIDSKIPSIVTVHDLIPIMFPKHYPPGIKGRINWQFQKNELKKVKSIISVSESVKKDIEKVLKIDSQRISVIYSAPAEIFRRIKDKQFLQRIREKYELPEEFVLYIGNVNWNKNILNITDGVLQANKKLVIIGNAFLDKTNLNHPEKKSFRSWVKKYGENSQIKILGFLPEKDVVGVLNLSSCLIFASLAEGFGLPILEAQACGIPVLTSNVSSMPEISGVGGAILVNPEIPFEIASGLKIIDEDIYREMLIDAGFENRKRFSWEKTAIETMKAYKNALS